MKMNSHVSGIQLAADTNKVPLDNDVVFSALPTMQAGASSPPPQTLTLLRYLGDKKSHHCVRAPLPGMKC
jgi:hypothetical protein